MNENPNEDIIADLRRKLEDDQKKYMEEKLPLSETNTVHVTNEDGSVEEIPVGKVVFACPTFDQYQAAAKTTAVYPKDANILYPALGLAGEVGEVAEKVCDGCGSGPWATEAIAKMASHSGEACNQVKKVIRDDGCELSKERAQAIGKEIGGVLWYCAALASDIGLNLGDIARENLSVLASRQERGKIKGDGDER